MIDKIFVWFVNGLTYVRKHPQLLMTILLIVIIPIAFLFSGQQFLEVGKSNQETLEKARISLFQDVLASFLKSTKFDQVHIQDEIQRLASSSLDIKDFQILKEEGSNLVIIASLNKTEIGEIIQDRTIYNFANTKPETSFILNYIENNQRLWMSSYFFKSDSNEDYYIYTKTSLEHIDQLFAKRIKSAYIWLVGILFVILILVIRHVRLIDYAYLYSETKKANQMKDLFTNMIAHELRTPLTSIRGYASLIRQKESATDEIKEFAERIEESSARLVLIVNDLLDVARIQSGKLSVASEKVDVKKLIASVIDSQTFTASEKGIKLLSEDKIVDTYIQGDEKRLYQAFTNLVSNSIKYTKSGSITLSAEEKSDRLEIRVKDTGMGMSAENQKNLFAPFFRIENTETKNIAGTGLGMWITKQLIELMKGSIAVESIKGVGTHIIVTLPK